MCEIEHSRIVVYGNKSRYDIFVLHRDEYEPEQTQMKMWGERER